MAQEAYPANTPVSSLSPMVRAWIRGRLQTPGKSPTEVAKEVGFRHPNAAGARLAKRCKLILQAEELRAFRKARMGLEEARAETAGIARNRNHKDQLQALKLILTMEGAFDNIDLPNRKSLMEQIDVKVQELISGGGQITATKLVVGPRADQVKSLPDLEKPLGQFGKAEPIEAEVVADSAEEPHSNTEQR